MSELLVAIGLLISVSAENEPERLARQIDQIAEEYKALRSSEEIQDLIALDIRLRNLLHEPWQPVKQSVDGKWRIVKSSCIAQEPIREVLDRAGESVRHHHLSLSEPSELEPMRVELPHPPGNS